MNKRQKTVLKSEIDAEKRTLDELKQVYQRAIDDCAEKISQLSMRTDLENIQSIVYQKKYQEAIKKQLEDGLKNLQSNQYSKISEYLDGCYKNAFLGNMYDLHGQGVPLIIPIDEKQIAKAITIDSKLSKPLYAALGEDVNKLKTAVRSQISRGIANGSSWNEIAKTLATRNFKNTEFSKAFNRASTIVRTEGHRVQNQARMDSMDKAKKKGADIVKQWDATLDGRTRETHRLLDGQIRELDDDFEVQGMKASMPGSFNDPGEDCNCRCAVLQRAKWALDEEELDTLKERAEFFGLDKSDDFEKFKNTYLNATNVDISKIDYASRRRQRMMQKSAEVEKKSQSILPDFDSMNSRQIKEYANNTLQTEFIGMDGANSDFIKEAVKTIDSFERKNGGTIKGLKVQFGGTPSGVYAKYDDKTNTLLLKKTGSLEAFEQRQIEENLRYKIKWKTDKNYHATTTYSGTVAHELGHAVDFSTGQALSKALSSTTELDELSVKISSYAGTSQNVRVSKRSEAWAENFAAYMEGGTKAREVPEEIVGMIEGYFKKSKHFVKE